MGGQVRVSGAALELPGGVTVRFMRTLRLPETGTHPLPPGLGGFPLRRVAEHPERVPAAWLEHGGVLLPVYRREAMWLSFSSTAPAALQVGVGKVSAISGRPWSDRLSQDPQNYVVLPRQPWLDGINSGQGTIRQFVALPPGPGGTVAGQAAGDEVWDGVCLQVFELRAEVLEQWEETQRERTRGAWYGAGAAPAFPPAVPGAGPVPPPAPDPVRAPPVTGLGTGGRMRQEVYRDERPPADWREQPSGRVFVHLATAAQWRAITGEPAPDSPVDRAAYNAAGLPWFDSYDDDDAEGTDGTDSTDATDAAPADPPTGRRPAGDRLGDGQPWVPPRPGRLRPLGDGPDQVPGGAW